jgi:hypothetical protein
MTEKKMKHPFGWNQFGDGKNLIWDEDLHAIMDGVLLGDGCYMSRRPVSASLEMQNLYINSDWILFLKDLLITHGATPVIRECAPRSYITKGNILINKKKSVYLYSGMLRNLLDERKRWYPNGIKIIPRDIDFSNPKLLAHWYMGDGSSLNGKVLLAKILTNGFTHEDVWWAISEVNRIHGLKFRMTKSKTGAPIMYTIFDDARKFFDIIRPYMCESFKYKVPEPLWKLPNCLVCGNKVNGRSIRCKYCDRCRKLIESGYGMRSNHKNSEFDVIQYAKIKLANPDEKVCYGSL